MTNNIVQILSWFNLFAGLSTYFLASRAVPGFWSFQKPWFHITQMIISVVGVVTFWLAGIPAWVIFNVVWFGIAWKTAHRTFRGV